MRRRPSTSSSGGRAERRRGAASRCRCRCWPGRGLGGGGAAVVTVSSAWASDATFGAHDPSRRGRSTGELGAGHEDHLAPAGGEVSRPPGGRRRGPSWSGGGHPGAEGEAAGLGLGLLSRWPPSGAHGRGTMRVTAMGEMALTTTPAGTRPPSCQVSEATARFMHLWRRCRRAASPSRSHAEHVAVALGGHDRQRRLQHVEEAVEVHREHAAPVVRCPPRSSSGG